MSPQSTRSGTPYIYGRCPVSFSIFLLKMANYASSLLTNAQTTLATKYNEAELRRKERPVLTMALNNAQYTLPDWESLKTAESRVVEVKYLKQRAPGSGTAKVALHTGTKGDSGTLNLAYQCLTETFYMSRKQAQNNAIGAKIMFQHEVEQAVDNLKDRMETLGLAYLAAHTCQLTSPATSGAGTWNSTNHALEIPAAKLDYFTQLSKTFMRGRLYRGDLDMIPDLQLWPSLERTMWQGAGNSTNLVPQMQGVRMAATSEVISASYTDGAAFIMPAGTFKALNWNDPLNKEGMDAGDNEVGMFGTLLDPFGSGFVFDVSKYSKRGDESANGGGVQDVLDQWEISAWVGWGVPPLSASNDSPVHLISVGA